jgi:hypothetical protein
LSAAGVAGDGRPQAQGARRARTDPLAGAVFALLVLACFAAFFITQRLKHTPTLLQRFEHTPAFAPRSAAPDMRQERISFKLSHAEAVTVSIIDAQGNTVATLVRDYPVSRYKQFSLRWNGRRGVARRFVIATGATGHQSVVPANTGVLAPAGEYRVSVILHGQGDREVRSPWSFTLERP